jgi:hypothetical protein
MDTSGTVPTEAILAHSLKMASATRIVQMALNLQIVLSIFIARTYTTHVWKRISIA